MPRDFNLDQLDQDRLIKENNLKQVTNPVMFAGGSGPTPDGLLSNEIFGITKDERAGIFAWIDLRETFINPYYYKIWMKLDKRLKSCVYETEYFIINSNGELTPSDNGGTGIKFLVDNIDKIKFKQSKKDFFLKALNDAKKSNKLFCRKFVIIPPYYRDVKNEGGRIGVGEINKLYVNLINSCRALDASNSFGLDMAGGVRGRIQDLLLEIYNWFTLGETVTGGEHTGSGIFKKFGVMRRSVMSKTTDYSARLVLSAPRNNVESQKDLMVDMNYSSIPLSAVCVISYPFMVYQLRQFFNNEFGGKIMYSYIDDKKQVQQVELLNPILEFSDDRFDAEMNEYIHGYSNRFKPVKIPNKEGKDITARFKGYYITAEQYAAGVRETGSMVERDLTWLDILYMSACEAVKNKVAIISRYPIDSHFNQFYTMIHIASTVETEPMVINGEFYPWYPKIRQSDINGNTANKFIDTLSMANPYCILMGADYDGDQVTCKMAFSEESNAELRRHMNSTAQFITLNGVNGRTADKESIQAIYNLTMVLRDTELDEPTF